MATSKTLEAIRGTRQHAVDHRGLAARVGGRGAAVTCHGRKQKRFTCIPWRLGSSHGHLTQDCGRAAQYSLVFFGLCYL